MSLDLLSEFDSRPDTEEVHSTELSETDDVLLKAVALGPGANVEPHTHSDATNVFHIMRGTLTVKQGSEEERITAPGTVLSERGELHGARNEGDEVAVMTVSLCPLPE
ncbi:cupin domain-containing protein [Haloarcula sp. JP-L23]|uniref:cupin domain-containing protein n=1 Tax=Haloarcula sp. JP-L23 TaxID=2716717 RepID=UPI00140F2CAB|nr:cupin domain-containing protein [Haloarcula sp. JP-L23]